MPKRIKPVYGVILQDELVKRRDSINPSTDDANYALSVQLRGIYTYLAKQVPPDTCYPHNSLDDLERDISQLAKEAAVAQEKLPESAIDDLKHSLVPSSFTERARSLARVALNNQSMALGSLVRLRRDALVTKLRIFDIGCEHCANAQCGHRDPHRLSPLDEYADQLASTAITQVRPSGVPEEPKASHQEDNPDGPESEGDDSTTIFRS